MKIFQLNLKCHKIVSLGIHAVRVTFADAILCAVCGGLYGMVFSGFGATVRHEFTVSGSLSTAGYCAMIGFAIGIAIAFLRELSSVFTPHQSLGMAKPCSAVSTDSRPSRLPNQSVRVVAPNSLICVSEKTTTRITAISG